MPDTLNIGSSKAVLVTADNNNRKTVLNHGGTVYYGASTVSSSSNDGSVTDGSSVTLSQSKHFISASSSQLVIIEVTDETLPGNQVVGGNLTVTGTAAITGAVTPAAGIVATVSPRVPTIPATSLTFGTDNTAVATETYFAEINLLANTTLTGISVLVGSVGGTDKFVVALYSSSGAVLANSAVAGVTVGTTATWQALPFTATYAAKGPAQYFVGLQCNGTTARFRSIAAGPQLATGKKTSEVFGTLTAITAPTTFTADLGPVAATY